MGGSVAQYPAQINSLTSIRYVAAAWVFFFHLKEYVQSTTFLGLSAVRFGYLGVDFFFVLSGFILAHVYKSELDEGRFDYLSFMAKRLGRIYPMHLLTLGLFLALGAVSILSGWSFQVWDPGEAFKTLDRGALVRALVAHLTLIHAWGSTSGLSFNLPSWSISAEWFAYLAFPAFMLLLRFGRRAPGRMVLLSLAVFVGGAIACALILKLELTKMSWNIGILRIGPEFLLGAALHGFGSRWTAGRRGAQAGLAGSILVVLAAVWAGAAWPTLASAGATVAVLGLASVVLFAADCERNGAVSLLSRPSLILLGEISYSVYMLHLFVAICVFEVLAPGFRPASFGAALATVCGTLALTTALSWATYRAVEVPGRRMIVSLARQLRAPATEPR